MREIEHMFLVAMLQQAKGVKTLGDIADQILDWRDNQKSFSTRITEDSKICPTCDQTLVYFKISFSKRCLTQLKLLSLTDRPMSYKELASLGQDKTYMRYFAELRHFGLTEPTGEVVDRCERYRITAKGKDFIAGLVTIPSFVYKKKGTDDVKVLEATPLLQISEVPEDNFDEITDKALHLENAIPI